MPQPTGRRVPTAPTATGTVPARPRGFLPRDAVDPAVSTPRRRVRLYSRPHIDLQRVAGALCRA